MNKEGFEIRLAEAGDLEALKAIWKLSFGDEDKLIDLYFQSRDWLSEVMVLVCDRRVASMLTMIPTDIAGADGGRQKASMLFAIATHPDFRNRGFADRLIEYSNRYQKENNVLITLLVPAGESLFRYYTKFGYRNGFFVRETELDRSEIYKLGGKAPGCRILSIGPEEYNRRRRMLLAEHDYLDYRDAETSFQKKIGSIYDSDLLAIKTGKTEGCAYYERISDEAVLVKELLIPEPFLAEALTGLSEHLPFQKIIIRTPPWLGESLGGTVRAFGMIRYNGEDSVQEEHENRLPYLGIAFD